MLSIDLAVSSPDTTSGGYLGNESPPGFGDFFEFPPPPPPTLRSRADEFAERIGPDGIRYAEHLVAELLRSAGTTGRPIGRDTHGALVRASCWHLLSASDLRQPDGEYDPEITDAAVAWTIVRISEIGLDISESWEYLREYVPAKLRTDNMAYRSLDAALMEAREWATVGVPLWVEVILDKCKRQNAGVVQLVLAVAETCCDPDGTWFFSVDDVRGRAEREHGVEGLPRREAIYATIHQMEKKLGIIECVQGAQCHQSCRRFRIAAQYLPGDEGQSLGTVRSELTFGVPANRELLPFCGDSGLRFCKKDQTVCDWIASARVELSTDQFPPALLSQEPDGTQPYSPDPVDQANRISTVSFLPIREQNLMYGVERKCPENNLRCGVPGEDLDRKYRAADASVVKKAAKGRMLEFLEEVVGVEISRKPNSDGHVKGQVCPKCQSKKRTLIIYGDTGASKCAREDCGHYAKDIYDTVAVYRPETSFQDRLEMLARYVDVTTSAYRPPPKTRQDKNPKATAEDVMDRTAAEKRVTVAAMLRYGATVVRNPYKTKRGYLYRDWAVRIPQKNAKQNQDGYSYLDIGVDTELLKKGLCPAASENLKLGAYYPDDWDHEDQRIRILTEGPKDAMALSDIVDRTRYVVVGLQDRRTPADLVEACRSRLVLIIADTGPEGQKLANGHRVDLSGLAKRVEIMTAPTTKEKNGDVRDAIEERGPEYVCRQIDNKAAELERAATRGSQTLRSRYDLDAERQRQLERELSTYEGF